MLVLFETPAGYAIFKLLDDKKLQSTENLFKDFETPQKASKLLKLKHFEKFTDTTEALSCTTAAVEGKISKVMKKMLKKLEIKDAHEKLLVSDAKLGSAIKEKMDVNCMSSTAVQELMRCIRSQIDGLLAGLPQKEMTAMALGLAHSLSRYKLKFSPDKVDTMVIQAICLLDDLDKEINNYVMRCREWYGWHFPELGKIVVDNIAFIKIIKIVGTREKMSETDMSEIIPEEIEEKVKEAAEISMGTEISEEDIMNIQQLCNEVLDISEYRKNLYEYLNSRMMAIAPNLTILVGELIGARLISHAGSLINLAKHPASTVQILGAEKALFRALKTHRDTPKYGLIYHAHLVGSTSSKNKGKVSRMLAAKTSLATRVDALGDDGTADLGMEHKAALTLRIRQLEEGSSRRISGTGKVKAKFDKYHSKSEVKQYPTEMDSTIPGGKIKRKLVEEIDSDESKPAKKIKVETQEEEVGSDNQEKKKKKKKKVKEEVVEVEEETPKKKKKKSLLIEEVDVEEGSAKKKKKKQSIATEIVEEPQEGKKKKKKHAEAEAAEVEEPSSEKKKKKKKKMSLP